MGPRPFIRMVLLAALLPAAAGCDWPDPYVLSIDEFNRSSPNFGRQPEDLETVSICYNGQRTTAEEAMDMARAECGKYGKVAQFVDQSLFKCSLLAPTRVNYRCLDQR